MVSKNAICLWFDGAALDAARFCAETFPDSAVVAVHRAPGDCPSGKHGDVLTAEVTVMGIWPLSRPPVAPLRTPRWQEFESATGRCVAPAGVPSETRPSPAAEPIALAAKPSTPSKPVTPAKAAKPAPARLTLAETMEALQAAGAEQTRKTYARHGVKIPMYGVSFAALKSLAKRIKIDHELALALWQTGNYDARNLAFKVVDPELMTPADLDHWSRDPSTFMCSSYVAQVAAEGPHGRTRVGPWLASSDERQRTAGWKLIGALAMLDESLDDAWFESHLAALEGGIHVAPNGVREAMNHTLIAIGCRSSALREAATAAAKRIGKVQIDYGDTACKTPDAVATLDKSWDYAAANNAPSPAAQERAREPLRKRC